MREGDSPRTVRVWCACADERPAATSHADCRKMIAEYSAQGGLRAARGWLSGVNDGWTEFFDAEDIS